AGSSAVERVESLWSSLESRGAPPETLRDAWGSLLLSAVAEDTGAIGEAHGADPIARFESEQDVRAAAGQVANAMGFAANLDTRIDAVVSGRALRLELDGVRAVDGDPILRGAAFVDTTRPQLTPRLSELMGVSEMEASALVSALRGSAHDLDDVEILQLAHNAVLYNSLPLGIRRLLAERSGDRTAVRAGPIDPFAELTRIAGASEEGLRPEHVLLLTGGVEDGVPDLRDQVISMRATIDHLITYGEWDAEDAGRALNAALASLGDSVGSAHGKWSQFAEDLFSLVSPPAVFVEWDGSASQRLALNRFLGAEATSLAADDALLALRTIRAETDLALDVIDIAESRAVGDYLGGDQDAALLAARSGGDLAVLAPHLAREFAAADTQGLEETVRDVRTVAARDAGAAVRALDPDATPSEALGELESSALSTIEIEERIARLDENPILGQALGDLMILDQIAFFDTIAQTQIDAAADRRSSAIFKDLANELESRSGPLIQLFDGVIDEGRVEQADRLALEIRRTLSALDADHPARPQLEARLDLLDTYRNVMVHARNLKLTVTGPFSDTWRSWAVDNLPAMGVGMVFAVGGAVASFHPAGRVGSRSLWRTGVGLVSQGFRTSAAFMAGVNVGDVAFNSWRASGRSADMGLALPWARGELSTQEALTAGGQQLAVMTLFNALAGAGIRLLGAGARNLGPQLRALSQRDPRAYAMLERFARNAEAMPVRQQQTLRNFMERVAVESGEEFAGEAASVAASQVHPGLGFVAMVLVEGSGNINHQFQLASRDAIRGYGLNDGTLNGRVFTTDATRAQMEGPLRELAEARGLSVSIDRNATVATLVDPANAENPAYVVFESGNARSSPVESAIERSERATQSERTDRDVETVLGGGFALAATSIGPEMDYGLLNRTGSRTGMSREPRSDGTSPARDTIQFFRQMRGQEEVPYRGRGLDRSEEKAVQTLERLVRAGGVSVTAREDRLVIDPRGEHPMNVAARRLQEREGLAMIVTREQILDGRFHAFRMDNAIAIDPAELIIGLGGPFAHELKGHRAIGDGSLFDVRVDGEHRSEAYAYGVQARVSMGPRPRVLRASDLQLAIDGPLTNQSVIDAIARGRVSVEAVDVNDGPDAGGYYNITFDVGGRPATVQVSHAWVQHAYVEGGGNEVSVSGERAQSLAVQLAYEQLRVSQGRELEPSDPAVVEETTRALDTARAEATEAARLDL
ncbi:MAG: hypothetical protein AAF658_03105, partial [Myxococcota bacterium]